MRKENQKRLYIAVCWLAAFVIWTVLVRCVDVQPVGPQGSAVGFAALNRFVHGLTGVHMSLYRITDWLSLLPIGTAAGFALLGLVQWIKRKRLGMVDRDILALGGFYTVVMAVYFLFERVAVNYRPVLINGCPEASYPSSTTVLVLCVMSTAILQLRARIQNGAVQRWAVFAVTLFTMGMVIGRSFSGVHWFTDIVGGVLLSAGLVGIYRSVSGLA